MMAAVLYGFKPVVVAVVIEAVLRIGRRAVRRRAHFVIAGLAFIGIYVLHVPFPAIVAAAAVAGLAGAHVRPDVFAAQKPAQIAAARRCCRLRLTTTRRHRRIRSRRVHATPGSSRAQWSSGPCRLPLSG